MKKLLCIGFLLFALVKIAGAQEQLSTRQQADRLYQRYEYYKAIQLYLRMVKKGKNDIKLLERLAECYYKINQYTEAEKWYAQAAADPKASAATHYYYAEVLLRDEKFDEAKAQYRRFYKNGEKALDQKLADCDSAKIWMKMPSDYQVKDFQSVNTESSDWGLTYYGKDRLMYTSDIVNDADKLDNRTGNNWFKLYETDLTGERHILVDVRQGLEHNLNDDYHFGPVALNPAGDTAYITATTTISKKRISGDTLLRKNMDLYTRRLELIVACKKNNEWKVARDFPYNNISAYSVGDAALSRDGKVLYFTSDMPGGFGKTDIWYCEKQRNGGWGKPVNCGNTINTQEEDEFPNIGGDGALYYASKGLPGMGGYDIYRAIGERAQWTKPQNLKYPINSTSDDFYLVTEDSYNGYFSSNRDGGKGNDDIYSFTRTHRTPPPAVAKTVEGQPPSGPATPTIKDGLVLTTIYYDLDKSNIRPDAAAELDKLAATLKQNPDVHIELASHTDSRASEHYNMALSQRRAEAAAEYLQKQGIDPRRLVLRHYGETQLVNQCADGVSCTEQQHQLNRRTEFKVIGNGN